MMNFYGIRKANSEASFRANPRANKLTAKRISNYELTRGNQAIKNNGILIDNHMCNYLFD